MNRETLKHLLYQYFNNTINPADCEELLSYLSVTNAETISDVIDEALESQPDEITFRNIQAQRILERIKADARFAEHAEKPATSARLLYFNNTWFKVAAVVLICIAIGSYFLKTNSVSRPVHEQTAKTISVPQIHPGKNKATLTLDSGRVITLDQAKTGLLTSVGNVSISKKNTGLLYYQPNKTGNKEVTNQTIIYNTLSTPKGGEYQVTLPDGTKVWLNSASSLTFPVDFTGNSRLVKLTGEAYFEVAKNASSPFLVSVNDMRIKVLGTHFNVSAYQDDEQATTTLLEGSVQVSKNKVVSVIKPGQQAVVLKNTDNINVSTANLQKAMAWKNGYFIFNDDNITQIMKQVARWYDVEVEYKGEPLNQRFGGTFYRSKSIRELLQHLEKIGNIHFIIDGRRIIVMK
jgi:transmembrane sensor